MSNVILTALYAEGGTDERFLLPLITRVTKYLLSHNNLVDSINPVATIKIALNIHKNVGDAIFQAAKQAALYDILVVHKDVDKRDWQATYQQLIAPGLVQIKQNPNVAICKQIVPLLPQHTIEAWMLADREILQKVIGTSKSPDELGLPKLKEVERRANPKEILRNALRLANETKPKRKREQADFAQSLGGLYEEMGEQVRLEQLRQLEAYQKFEEALSAALDELGFM